MELEFDKEIDAILRKARTTRGVLVGDKPADPKKHLDADTIAAFAENALPASARVLYTVHFADCGRCRSQLSQAIAMDREADAAAASTVLAPVASQVPWYEKLLQVRSLAVAMGALVLVFSGVLGFLVLQREGREAANSAVLSQADPDTGHGPYYAESGAANANASISATSNTAAVNRPDVAAASAPNTAVDNAPSIGRATTSEERTADDKGLVLDGTTGGAPEARPAAPAAAAPPRLADERKTESENNVKAGEDEIAKEKDLARAESREKARSRMDRDAATQSLKNAGPTRSGPMQKQSNQVNAQTYEMSVTRSVGGKTFFNRNGAWVDTTYGGQSPVMIRRGSSEFKKLDSGLRNIAGELYGTVTVVWKGKAYRIQ